MSKQLQKALAEGKVVVYNKKTGEANVVIPDEKGGRKSILVGGHATVEIAPKHVNVKILKRGSNIQDLVQQGILRIL